MRGVIAIVFLALAIAGSARAEDPIETEIMKRIELTPRHRLHDEIARAEFVRDIYTVSAAHDIDARVILMTSFFKSSWLTTARGSIGEVGLMQIHGVAASGCDMATQRGQRREGNLTVERVHCVPVWTPTGRFVGRSRCTRLVNARRNQNGSRG